METIEGTPTDNAITEAINGWIKEELILDFGLETALFSQS
jgi:hypothetical protein